jgi:hypothetical protein
MRRAILLPNDPIVAAVRHPHRVCDGTYGTRRIFLTCPVDFSIPCIVLDYTSRALSGSLNPVAALILLGEAPGCQSLPRLRLGGELLNHDWQSLRETRQVHVGRNLEAVVGGVYKPIASFMPQ